MKSELADKTVLITGASGGIGRATARAFAEEGCRLVLHYRRNRRVCESLARELSAATLAVGADTRKEDQVELMFQHVINHFGKLDVLVGSTAGLFGEEGHADYATAKAGMIYGLTKSLKNEIVRLAPNGRVNCVCPGWVDTPMAAKAMSEAGAVQRATSTMALRKVATPQDVANTLVFFSSDSLAGHLSGTILPLDGGMEGRVIHPE